MAAAYRGYLRAPGEWNYQEVTVIGPTIKVELNGNVILNTDLSKITEYMALGKPIVAYDLPESRHSADQAAVFARRNDEYDFAVKILELANDPEMRQRLGAIGQRRIQNLLSWQHSAQNLLDTYERLLGPIGATVRA